MKINHRLIKIIIVVLILAIYGITLTHKINLTTDDLGRHLANGQIIWQTKSVPKTNFYSYTEPNFPFINHHWLSGLLFYFIFSLAGFNGLIIFKIIVLLSAFTLIFYIAAKKGNFWLAAVFSLPMIILLNQRTDVRPEIISFLFIAIFLYALLFWTDKPNKKIFLLIPLQLIWINCHIYWPVGILMVTGYLFEKIIKTSLLYPILSFPRKRESRKFPKIRPWGAIRSNLGELLGNDKRKRKDKKIIKNIAFLLLLLILVCFINPAGIKGAAYPFKIFKNYGYQIVENKSPFFLENLMKDLTIPYFKIVSLVLIISFLFNLDNFSIFYFLAATAVVIGSGKMIRNFPLLGLIALPVLSINFSSLLNHWPAKIPICIKKLFLFLFVIFLLIFAILLTNSKIKLNNKEFGLNLTFQTNNSAEFFKKNNLKGPIFNNYDIGSYLIFHLREQEKVFTDNRPEAYPLDFFENIYKPMQLNQEEWQKQMEDYNFNVIFFTHQESTPWGQTFVSQRFQDSDWPLIYADNHTVIFIKNIPENQSVISQFQITPENIAEKISELIDSDNIKDKFSAINLLSLIGRNDLAIKICQDIIEENPKNSRAWLELSSIEASQNTQTGLLSAKRALEKAIKLGEKLPSVYIQLGLINFELQQYQEAKAAWQKALKIDKDNEHAKSYLEQYQELNLP